MVDFSEVMEEVLVSVFFSRATQHHSGYYTVVLWRKCGPGEVTFRGESIQEAFKKAHHYLSHQPCLEGSLD